MFFLEVLGMFWCQAERFNEGVGICQETSI